MHNSDTMAWVHAEELVPRLTAFVEAYERHKADLYKAIEANRNALREYERACRYAFSHHPSSGYDYVFEAVAKSKRLLDLCALSKNGEVLIGDQDLEFVRYINPKKFGSMISELNRDAEIYQKAAQDERERESLEATKKPAVVRIEATQEEEPPYSVIPAYIGIAAIIILFAIVIIGGAK